MFTFHHRAVCASLLVVFALSLRVCQCVMLFFFSFIVHFEKLYARRVHKCDVLGTRLQHINSEWRGGPAA